jgi:hypothetical protein
VNLSPFPEKYFTGNKSPNPPYSPVSIIGTTSQISTRAIAIDLIAEIAFGTLVQEN